MKTTVITETGNLYLLPLDGAGYRMTGHTMPTRILANDNDLIDQLVKVEDGEQTLRLLAKDNAIIVLTPDTRHGQSGWRGTRYEESPNKTHKVWDEWYLFFNNPREAIELFGTTPEKMKTGIREARQRF